MVLDGGATNIGIESTVLDVTSDPPTILRPGWITLELLSEAIGPIAHSTSDEELRRSPGTRHQHYSPRARVILIERGSPAFIERVCKDHLSEGGVGFIGHTPVAIAAAESYQFQLGNEAGDYAHSIYAALRELDKRRVSVVVVEGISERGEGAAVMDRLRRASVGVVTED